MWSVSAYDEDSEPMVSFEIEDEEELKELVGRILTVFKEKRIRLLEVESLL